MKATIIREPWISEILAGRKTWEMRSRPVKTRGLIGLIRKGSGQVVATARLIDSPASLNVESYTKTVHLHRIPLEQQASVIAQGWVYPWILADVRPLHPSVPYSHKGGVGWVTLDSEVETEIMRRVDQSTGAVAQRLHRETEVHHSQTGKRAHDVTDKKVLSKRMKVEGRIEGDRCIIPITEGNITHGHIYLRSVVSFFPSDSIGGSDESQSAARSLTLSFDGGPVVSTDIAGPDRHDRPGKSAHYIFRHARSAVLSPFFERTGATAGDQAIITRTSPYCYSIRLLKSGRTPI
ncbi:hypothetical protein [Bradyrhizobium sp. STM 3809]|uniref:hypothetical protein n=1 Tax=Bradyrhizobium sp. STM 3809 TaxID=551936 RepID=UPI00024082D1|nr:hypothetical protein [Bradyrhizobium sp. STM 3809]CCE03760.1 hypothetical protein BRAS3809_7910008 [Bradyrhizobium sp. STM 3809]